MCMFCRSLFVLLAIVLSVLLRFTQLAIQLYVRVGILLACGKHWHRVSVYTKTGGLVHKTNLTHHFFLLKYLLY